MKLSTLIISGKPVVAAVSPVDERYLPVSELGGQPVRSMHDVIANAAALANGLDWREAKAGLAALSPDIPIRPRRNILCVGKNYRDHVREFSASGFDTSAASSGADLPAHAVVFTKPPESMIPHGASIHYPVGVSDSVDYEAELAVVIGKGGRAIPRERALDHVFGYTIINDVTARDLQARHQQWFIGKSLDTFCPIGPCIVTRDEIDLADTRLRCWVNGELRQDANTADMIFDVPAIIETLSRGMTLLPGDVIATGTPSGVGAGFNPPHFLHPGDMVVIEIAGIGSLMNRVE